MVTLIANQLDSNYSQTHINNFYTQAKKLIREPFDFIVFTTPEEMELLETTKKREGYIDGITFHVPKYGKDWIEIDLIRCTARAGRSFFITPNVILNDPKTIFNYRPSGGIEKLILEDGNLCYFIHRNEKVEKIINKWNEMEDSIVFDNHEFEHAFFSNVIEDFTFLQNTNKTYPEKTEGNIVALPYWYIDYTDEQLDLMYNRATDLYPYLPSQVQIEMINNNNEYLTLDQIKDSFSEDFIKKSKLKRIIFKGLEGEPTNNPEFTDICEYLGNHWGIGIDLNTTGETHDKYWWGTIGTLFRNAGNISMNIDTPEPSKKILENVALLVDIGCRVFWNFTHKTRSQMQLIDIPMYEDIHVDVWYDELDHLNGQHVWYEDAVYKMIKDQNKDTPFNLKNVELIESPVLLYEDDNDYLMTQQNLLLDDIFLKNNKIYSLHSKDVIKAKDKAKELGFTGFIYNNEIKPKAEPIKKEEKKEMPDYNLISLDTLQTVKQDDIYKERKVLFSKHIKCEGKVNNQFYLNATGNVFPCKNVALNIITANNSPEHKTELLYDWEKNNIDNHSLETIFTNNFYKGYFNNLLKLNPLILHNEQGGRC